MIPERFHGYFKDDKQCQPEGSATKGRHLLAAHGLATGSRVLTSEAYLTSLLSSYRKRICAYCRVDNGRRLALHCRDCDVPYYCSIKCSQRHAEGLPLVTGLQAQLPRTVPSVPHTLVCPVLRHTGSIKVDADMECILHMLVDILALQHLENQGAKACALHCNSPTGSMGSVASTGSSDVLDWTSMQQTGQRVVSMTHPDAETPEASGTPSQQQTHGCTDGSSTETRNPLAICHADFELLQHHPESMSERDLQEWKLALKHLRSALERAQWPEPVPPEAVLLSWVGRIAANSFGLHVDPSAGIVPLPAAAGVADEEPASASIAPAEVAAARLAAFQLAQRQLWSEDQPDCMAEGLMPTTHTKALPSVSINDSQSSDTPSALQLRTSPSRPSAAATEHVFKPTNTADHMLDGKVQTCELSAEEITATSAALGATSSCLLGLGNNSAQPGRLDNNHGTSFVQGARDILGVPESIGSNSSSARAVGRELFITGSYFNHSCAPNCIIYRRGAFGFVFTQADVQTGEELCISYIDLEPPRASRRSELLKFFHFDCECSRCRREYLEGSGKSSYKAAAPPKNTAPKRRGRKARISR